MMCIDRRQHDPRTSRREAFTLMEMLVAVAIIVILTIVTVPSFSAIKSNLDASAARNAMSATLSQARTLAVQSEAGDVVVAFLYDRERRVSQVIVGQIVDELNGVTPGNHWDVAVPLPNGQARDLPKNWEVRGLGYAITTNWYDGHDDHLGTGTLEGVWLSPESDAKFAEDSEPRQSFMIRFAQGTGSVVTANPMARSANVLFYVGTEKDPIIDILDVEPSDQAAYNELVDQGAVRLRPSPALAMYDVEDLAAKIQGASIDRASGTLYDMDYSGGGSYVSSYRYIDANGDAFQAYDAIRRYLEENVDPIVFNRFTGQVLRSDRR